MPTTQTHYRTCNLCEAMCGLEIKLENNEIKSIKGDNKDPFSKGFICPKATALQDIYNDPDRLKKPIKKVNGEWKEISWNKAYDLVAEGIKKVQKKYGNDAVAAYQGNPTVHNIGSMLFSSDFLRALKTNNKYSASSIDQLPQQLAAQWMFGHIFTIPIPDINRTDYFLVLGANPMISNGSLMSAAGMPNRIKELQARGGKMIVVDPRKTKTAEAADHHIFIKPGKDVFFLAAIIHEFFERKYIDIFQLSRWISGRHDLQSLFDRFSPENVENICGVTKEIIEQIAKDFIEADKAVCYGRMGVSTQEHGTLCHWLINLINILSNNFDKQGGAMFPKAAVDVVSFISKKSTEHRYDRFRSRVRDLPETNGELPVAVLAREMLTPGKGQVKAFICSSGNPLLSTPNGKQLNKALRGLDFMVSIDIYLNETSQHADVILPPATGLETEHYDLFFNNLAVSNVAKYSPPLFKPEAGMQYDWQIFKELTRRLKKRRTLMERILFPFLNPGFMLNIGLKKGPYPINLKKLKNNPHGLDLGPLQPRMPEYLFTNDKKLHLAPALLISQFEKLDLVHEKPELVLIGRRELRSNNSWMHNSYRLVKGENRCTILIHSYDAKRRNVMDGDLVEVKSNTGSISLPAEITNNIMQGVVSIPHGYGHNSPGSKLDVANAHAGVSINDITDEGFLDALSGNAAFSGVEVEIEKMTG